MCLLDIDKITTKNSNNERHILVSFPWNVLYQNTEEKDAFAISWEYLISLWGLGGGWGWQSFSEHLCVRCIDFYIDFINHET